MSYRNTTAFLHTDLLHFCNSSWNLHRYMICCIGIRLLWMIYLHIRSVTAMEEIPKLSVHIFKWKSIVYPQRAKMFYTVSEVKQLVGICWCVSCLTIEMIEDIIVYIKDKVSYMYCEWTELFEELNQKFICTCEILLADKCLEKKPQSFYKGSQCTPNWEFQAPPVWNRKEAMPCVRGLKLTLKEFFNW